MAQWQINAVDHPETGALATHKGKAAVELLDKLPKQFKDEVQKRKSELKNNRQREIFEEFIADEEIKLSRKLADYGIAPPGVTTPHHPADGPVALSLSVRCPQCGSPDTRETSRFGSTACKSLWQCRACREPFDHFKAI